MRQSSFSVFVIVSRKQQRISLRLEGLHRRKYSALHAGTSRTAFVHDFDSGMRRGVIPSPSERLASSLGSVQLAKVRADIRRGWCIFLPTATSQLRLCETVSAAGRLSSDFRPAVLRLREIFTSTCSGRGQILDRTRTEHPYIVLMQAVYNPLRTPVLHMVKRLLPHVSACARSWEPADKVYSNAIRSLRHPERPFFCPFEKQTCMSRSSCRVRATACMSTVAGGKQCRSSHSHACCDCFAGLFFNASKGSLHSAVFF